MKTFSRRRHDRRRIGRAHLIRSAAVVLALVALVSCSSTDGAAPSSPDSSGAAPNSFEQQRETGLTQLLGTWATALRADDEATLRSLFDQSAPPQFVDAQIARARNLVGVPLSDFGFEIDDQPEAAVPTGVASTIVGATDIWSPAVSLRYAFDGADIGPTHVPVSLVVARRGDDWKLVTDADDPDSSRTTWHGPWDFGPVVTRTVDVDGTRSLVIGHEDRQSLIDALADQLTTALPAVTAFWGPGWSRRAVVMVSSSDAEFASLGASAAEHPGVAAATIADPVEQGFVTGQRIVFSPEAQDRLTPTTQRTVLRHELTHVATRSVTTDGSPLWMLEGIADYVGYSGVYARTPADPGSTFAQIAPTLTAVVGAGGPPTVLPQDSDFAAGGARGAIAYEAAWSISEFVAETYGEPVLRQMYRSLATGPVNATQLEQRLKSLVGSITGDFIDTWGAWVKQRTG